MSRIEELMRSVAAGEEIDVEQEADLMALEFARRGEVFAAKMIELWRLLDEPHEYSKEE